MKSSIVVLLMAAMLSFGATAAPVNSAQVMAEQTAQQTEVMRLSIIAMMARAAMQASDTDSLDFICRGQVVESITGAGLRHKDLDVEAFANRVISLVRARCFRPGVSTI